MGWAPLAIAGPVEYYGLSSLFTVPVTGRRFSSQDATAWCG
jgi:hypothetical protein